MAKLDKLCVHKGHIVENLIYKYVPRLQEKEIN